VKNEQLTVNYKPVILMTGSSDLEPKRKLKRVYYYKNYAEAMEAAGAIILNTSAYDKDTVSQLMEMADGLFLTGGTDIEPHYYNEPTQEYCGSLDSWRDDLECAWAKAFLSAGKPILGVCRGMQMLNVIMGGSLWQDITAQTQIIHPYDSIHKINTAENSILRELFSEEFEVNSFHHQSIKETGAELIPTAWDASTQIIEAFHHQSLPVWAVQWHPERMIGEDRYTKVGPDMMPLFQFFVNKCLRKNL